MDIVRQPVLTKHYGTAAWTKYYVRTSINIVVSIYILEDLYNYVRPFLKIPLFDFDQTFRDGGDPP